MQMSTTTLRDFSTLLHNLRRLLLDSDTQYNIVVFFVIDDILATVYLN